jgi:hypothetical protein
MSSPYIVVEKIVEECGAKFKLVLLENMANLLARLLNTKSRKRDMGFDDRVVLCVGSVGGNMC